MMRIVWGSSAPPPPPPSTPPLSPQHLCKVGVVGDSQSGKTSMMQRFVCRKCARDEEGNQEPLDCDDTNGSSSLQVRSNLSVETVDPTLAEYKKKDVTMFSQEHQAEICVRIQMWDMNLHYHFMGQDVSTTASIPSNASWSTNQPTACFDFVTTCQQGRQYYCLLQVSPSAELPVAFIKRVNRIARLGECIFSRVAWAGYDRGKY